jgi:hypothetical protein
MSWFLYALCAFASCIDRYGGRRKPVTTSLRAPILGA